MKLSVVLCSTSMLLVALNGCSFIDDFDRFRPEQQGRDGGARDAGMDAQPEADAEPEDAAEADATEDAAERDAQVMGDGLCVGKADGMACGDSGQLICLKGFCRISRCGDGFVDVERS